MLRIKNKFATRHHKLCAFTLIELLIAASIAAIVGLALLFTFATGLKAYSKVKDYNSLQADALISFEKIEGDLRNTVHFTGIDFIGDKRKMSFAGFINQNSRLGGISYFFDAKAGGVLIRTEQPYSYALLGNKPDGIEYKVLASVKDVNFSYCHLNPDTHKYDWNDSWGSSNGIPKAMKIKVIFREGDKNFELEKTVFMPVSD